MLFDTLLEDFAPMNKDTAKESEADKETTLEDVPEETEDVDVEVTSVTEVCCLTSKCSLHGYKRGAEAWRGKHCFCKCWSSSVCVKIRAEGMLQALNGLSFN